jgi:hypothetical protein
MEEVIRRRNLPPEGEQEEIKHDLLEHDIPVKAPNLKIQQLLDDFLNRGVLYTHDIKYINTLRKVCFEIDPEDKSTSRISPYVVVAMEANQPDSPTRRNYLAAKVFAKETVISSPEYKELYIRWSAKTLAGLKKRLANDIPPEIIDEILQTVKQEHVEHFSWFTEIDLLTLKQIEAAFYEEVRQIDKGINYHHHIWKLFQKMLKQGEPIFVLLRANSIEDLLDQSNPFGMPNVGDELRGHFHALFRWLGRTETPTNNDDWYIQWYTVTYRLVCVDPVWCNLLTGSLPGAEIVHTPPFINDVVEITGSILAAMLSSGTPDHVAQELMIPILHNCLKQLAIVPPEQGDLFLRKWLWSAAGWAHSPVGIMSHVSYGLSTIRDWASANIAPLGFIQALSNVVTSMSINVFVLADRLLELIFTGLNDYTNIGYLTLAEYFYASRSLLSGLLPEARRRPKTVWALLNPNNFTNLSPADKFALGCKIMVAPETTPDYHEWATNRLQQLKDFGADVSHIPSIPIRGFRLPPKPTVAAEELAALAPLMPSTVGVHETASAFVRSLHDKGVPAGLDGTWFATKERIVQSISRYDVDVVPIDDIVRTRSLRAAHALADKFPSMYKNAQWLTPGAAVNKIIKKYSPGLPFIPDIRDRKELVRLGVFAAMVRLAEKYLQEGIHPGSMAHCFVKSDIIKLQKLLDGKNIRTIVAADLMSNLIQYCSSVEVTRRQPPIDAFVMNAVPRTEGGFRPFYDVLKTMNKVIMADATEFDSKLPPVISVDALAELRSLGYDGQLIKPIAESQNWATYLALRFAGLINLATGEQLPHTQGLMTGQGNTGVDNRDAFRLIIITAWSMVTNQDPARFWDKNVLGNAGDDDAIGSNEDDDVWPRVIEYIRNQFGMVITIEAEGFENLALVGLRPIPVPETSIKYYNIAGLPVPAYSIAGDRMALLMKRTEYRVRVSGFRDAAFLMKHIEGVIGSAYLTAHLPDVYDTLTDEYMKEVSQIMLRFFKIVNITEKFDETGNRVGVLLVANGERDRYKDATKSILAWLKSHRWPDYANIMSIALRPQDVRNTKMSKDHRKLLMWNPRIPRAEAALYGLIRLREAMFAIPNHVARSMPEFKGLDPSYLMRNPNYPIAKFVWLSLYHKNGRKIPKGASFLAILKENPYGSAEDGIGFLNWLTNDNHVDDLVSEDLEEYRAQMVFMTIIYWFVEDIFKSTRNLPILSILFNLYAFSMRDINRLYSVLNYFHFIATGRSSVLISNMMPPDPYAWVKQFAAICSILVPRKVLFYILPGVKWIAWPIPRIVEMWAAGDALIQARPFRLAHDLIAVPHPWGDLVSHFTPWLLDQKQTEPILVVAPTGTGKSTALIAAIINTGFIGTIWLNCPTIVSRDSYDNPFLLGGLVQILHKGVPNLPEQRVKIGTYGHFLIRIPREISAGDLVIFDEQHLGEMDMWRAWSKFSSHKRLTITATPVPGRMPISERRFTLPGGRRFNTKVVRTNLDFPDLLSLLATDEPVRLSRALIVVPTMSAQTRVRQTLDRLSLTSYPMSSAEPTVPSSGIIVATTIVDTAITINPPPSCLIDFGLTLTIDYDYSGMWLESNPRSVPTGPSAHLQRLGRVGRSGDSIAYIMAQAGTGAEPAPRVTAFGILFDQDTEANMLAAYGLIMPLVKRDDKTNNEPGLLRYLTLSPDLDVGPLHPNSLALAMFIWTMQSDLMRVETIKELWQDLKLEISEHEIINVIVTDIRNNGYGNPLIGNWDLAVDLLGSGALGVLFLVAPGVTRFQHCTGICIQDRIIGPIGFDKNLLVNYITLDNVYNSLTPQTLRAWIGYKRFLLMNDHFPISVPLSGVIPTHIDLTIRVDSHDQPIIPDCHVTSGTEIARLVHLQTDQFRGRILYGRSDTHNQFKTGSVSKFKFLATSRRVWPHPQIIDLTICYPQPGITDLGLAICVAAGLTDGTTLVWGEPDETFDKLARDVNQLGFIVNPEMTMAIINPRYARRWVNLVAFGALRNICDLAIANIPKRVLLRSPVDRVPVFSNEIHVYLDSESKLRVAL